MYSTLAVSASCNIGTYKGMSLLRTYTHIYRGFCTVFVADICTGMSMHTVLLVCCYILCSVLQECTMQALAWYLVVQFRTVWFVAVIYTLDTRI